MQDIFVTYIELTGHFSAIGKIFALLREWSMGFHMSKYMQHMHGSKSCHVIKFNDDYD